MKTNILADFQICITFNHGQKGAILKENSSWLLPFFMTVAMIKLDQILKDGMKNSKEQKL